jgi:FMN phosphatase YigB (HAD superfamily)
MLTKTLINMLFVYDFDGTLYRTGEMWKCWLGLLQARGYPKERAEEKGPLVFWEGFTPARHVREIDPECGDACVQDLDTSYRDYIQSQKERSLFPDVIDHLKKIPKEQQIIMTHGDPKFQQYKVNASGAGKYVRAIQVSRPDNRKVEQLAALAKSSKEEVIYIENNPRELREVLEAKLSIALIRMSREGERHADIICPEDEKEWRVITSLEQI